MRFFKQDHREASLRYIQSLYDRKVLPFGCCEYLHEEHTVSNKRHGTKKYVITVIEQPGVDK